MLRFWENWASYADKRYVYKKHVSNVKIWEDLSQTSLFTFKQSTFLSCKTSLPSKLTNFSCPPPPLCNLRFHTKITSMCGGYLTWFPTRSDVIDFRQGVTSSIYRAYFVRNQAKYPPPIDVNFLWISKVKESHF